MGLLRGIAVTWIVVGAPFTVPLGALLVNEIAQSPVTEWVASICMMAGMLIVFPHADLYTSQPGPFSGYDPLMLALVQWAMVSIVVGWSTKGSSLRKQFAVAAAAVLLVSLTTILLALLRGFRPKVS